MKRLAALLLLAACGGSAPDIAATAPPDGGFTVQDAARALGVACTPDRPVECPVVVGRNAGDVCGNDRFGFTCTAYCTDQPCQQPGTKCLPRLGDVPGATGFCWRSCSKDADCLNGLRCHVPEGVCGP